VDHHWLEKFLEHRIADGRVLRLIGKWLSAGVMEKGEWSETEGGTYSAGWCPGGRGVVAV
jgi:RNA-directed DNA polymerase